VLRQKGVVSYQNVDTARFNYTARGVNLYNSRKILKVSVLYLYISIYNI